VVLAWQEFKDGNAHIRATCKACGRFLGYARKTNENAKLAQTVYQKPEAPRLRKRVIEYFD